MAVTIVANLVVFSDSSGTGNQSHLVYATNQQRWWLFSINSKTATVVNTYVSSSNDLTTATWSAGTSSASLPRAVRATDQRNLGVLFLNPGSSPTTDAAHVSVGLSDATNDYMEHCRCTFTGASSISWDASWTESLIATGTTAVLGNVLGVGTDGLIHEASQALGPSSNNGGVRISTNADTSATWTNGFGSPVEFTASSSCRSYALATLSSTDMLAVADNGSSTTPNELQYGTYNTGTTWPAFAGSLVGTTSINEDRNDWCLCTVDATHIYAFRKSGTNTFSWRKYNGSSWSTPANGVPNQNHLAGSGMFAATDGTSLWLFVLDSASNSPLMYCQASTANGATPTWGAWTQLEAAGSTARNYVSGSPAVGNSQVGVIFTAVNGLNFDIVVSALSTLSPLMFPTLAALSFPDANVCYPGFLVKAG